MATRRDARGMSVRVAMMVALAVVAMLASGCTSHAAGRAVPLTQSPPSPPVVGRTSTDAGAAAPASGSPAFCATLAGMKSVRGLRQEIDDLADPATAQAASASLHQAAKDLRGAEASVPSQLAGKVAAAADSLDALATRGLSDATATTALSDAFSALGNEVQARCHFPLG